MKYILSAPLLLLPVVMAIPHKRDGNSTSTNETIISTPEPLFGANGLLNISQALKGIIFGDYEAQAHTQRFNGSLAVQGNFTGSGLTVNNNDAVISCTENNGTLNLSSYGLIVGGKLVAQNVTVNGAVYSEQMTYDGINFIDNGCSNSKTTTPPTKPVDFEALKSTAFNISQYFASQKPNMVIRDGGFISDGQFKGDKNQNYYIFTFGLCQQSPCVLPNYLYSSLEQIFSGGNWTGPWNSGYLLDKPIVFNIPVLADTVFNMSTANPAAGLEQAQVLYNVYPANNHGAFDPNGHFVWLRNTTEFISGHILAPAAFVVENNKAGFQGQLIAARYFSVENLGGSNLPLNSSASATTEAIVSY